MQFLNNKVMVGSVPLFLTTDFVITWYLKQKLKFYL